MKPVIGVMPLVDNEKKSLWILPGYFDGIIEAGGIPVMLPLTSDKSMIQQCVDMCDGFLFTGGHDVSPSIYGEEPLIDNIDSDSNRDNMETIILKLAMEQDKAILGICRGIQFINASLGGSLYQDIPSQCPSEIDHHQTPPYNVPVHDVIITPNTPLFDLLKQNKISVNSYHHQAVKNISDRLIIMAKATDGIIEAVYCPDRRFLWAVQWHPEFSHEKDENSKRIFRSFIEAAN